MVPDLAQLRDAVKGRGSWTEMDQMIARGLVLIVSVWLDLSLSRNKHQA